MPPAARDGRSWATRDYRRTQPQHCFIARDRATVELRDTPDCVEIEVDLPGLTPADIHLTVEDHRVRIQGTPAAVTGRPRPPGLDRTLEFTTLLATPHVAMSADESIVTITLPKRTDADTDVHRRES